jgi:hypothetical protein
MGIDAKGAAGFMMQPHRFSVFGGFQLFVFPWGVRGYESCIFKTDKEPCFVLGSSLLICFDYMVGAGTLFPLVKEYNRKQEFLNFYVL